MLFAQEELDRQIAEHKPLKPPSTPPLSRNGDSLDGALSAVLRGLKKIEENSELCERLRKIYRENIIATYLNKSLE